MLPKEVNEKLDEEFKKLKDVPFDKALPLVRNELWEIADHYGMDGADVFKQYMDWKSAQL